MTLEQYLYNINKLYKIGNATDHTFRGDLQQLLESIVQGRTPNLIPEIIKQIADKLGLTFVPEKPAPLLLKEGLGVVENNKQHISPRAIDKHQLNNRPYLKTFRKELRNNLTPAEAKFWTLVQNSKLEGRKFRRQHSVGNYILDFYCPSEKLAIELDGEVHFNETAQLKDAERTLFLNYYGIKVLRFENKLVFEQTEQVLDEIKESFGWSKNIPENVGLASDVVEVTTTPAPPLEGGELREGGELGELGDGVFAPIDILDYIYAILHSPTYREKYKEFLKIDFPRVPYPKDKETFWQLVKLGGEIRQIHLLESPTVDKYITQYPEDGDNIVTKPHYFPIPQNEKTGDLQGNVYINETQYFANVPLKAWKFFIGGYQPAQKWLKDRKDRKLEFDDILHYQKIIVALSETVRLMKEIDKIDI
jgi:very-short-patch-repair endonuclease